MEATVDDVKERVRRELEHLEPSPGGFEKTLRRVRRRERNRRVGAGAVAVVAMAGLSVGLWLTLGPHKRPPAGHASPTPAATITGPRLFLAGDGEMWIVAVDTGSVHHLKLPELSPGDPPYKIVRRGDKLVLWGYTTYVLDPTADPRLRVLVRDSLVFVPSAVPDRVWVAINSSDTGHIGAIREVSVDGRVTVPDTKPPGGQLPVAALTNGLVFQLSDGRLEVWNPVTGGVVRTLTAGFPVTSRRNLLVWCGGDCHTLHVTDVVTGKDIVVSPPPGTSGFDRGMFSPDGETIAVAVHTGPLLEGLTTLKSQLALVNVRTGTARIVDGTTVKGAYVFVDWSPSGDSVFITGGNQFETRTIVEYRRGADSARRLQVKVGDFYGMAAA
jgi:hypothetical protein